MSTHKSKPETYAAAVVSGKSKKEAKEEAGYSPQTSTTKIESTEGFRKAIETHLMTLEEAFAEHRSNLKQRTDKKAKNTALDMYYKLYNAYPKEQSALEGDFEIIVRSKKDE